MVSADRSAEEDLLAAGLAELGLEANPATLQALAALARLLETWAERINLTAHRGAAAITRRLILDAAALHQSLPAWETLVDLGSGAGFPGLPIAILSPSRTVVLVESRRRRHHFQRAAVRELGLGNVTARLGRLDEIEPSPASIAVAQALGPRSEVAQWMLPWATPGGWLAVPGSPDSAAPAAPAEGLSEERICEYRVPLGGPVRGLWLGRRHTSTNT